MPSISSFLKILAVLGIAGGIEAMPRPQPGHKYPHRPERRQDPAPPAASPSPTAPVAAPAGGLSDIDILQFALSLEHLESNFYSQGFQRFPPQDFSALGLSEANIQALQAIGETEATHVTALTSAISATGAPPVQACTYNFNFTTAADMVATARILEAVGVSAYLGAAPLIQSKDILSTAGSILTVESRHQTFIRAASAAAPVPAPFDTPLGPRAVFTLASGFIQSCPEGSNLNIPAFPAIQLSTPMVTAGQSLVLQDTAQPSGAQFCAYVNQGQTMFTPLQQGACTVPQGLAGEVYMMVTGQESVVDEAVLAG
ncbi:hypothetical protein P152DRAFT_393101 [Eremomyces bilateralis CBS 781.70]|uniref:Uncharacterized protein n=1 Tax=Eremomyces bilateralis CBS 781.70 TaxID=1392243 RepID=A0A6G1G804_9PEZI|nr:uncharacterized protein P152DRAFT_393101 [Eremomyces bilateralis CBS 781.70]KAF1814235.1 hypothetical protein P152DRAFT_393101 [Eremomyces bilateralis CBS 781.70]